MNKFIFFSLALSNLFLTNNLVAQVFVSNNSFIYNKGSVVFSKGNLELNGANSNFYLRNEGQLLQGTTGSNQIATKCYQQFISSYQDETNESKHATKRDVVVPKRAA